MKKNKGINAKAWFYSQSFVSSATRELDSYTSFQRAIFEDVNPPVAKPKDPNSCRCTPDLACSDHATE